MSLLLGYFWLGEEREASKNMDSKRRKKVSPGEGTFSYCIFPCGPETKPLIPNPFRFATARAKIFPPKDVPGLRFFCLKFLLGKMWGFQLDLFCPLKTRGMLMGCPIRGPCLPALPADLSCSCGNYSTFSHLEAASWTFSPKYTTGHPRYSSSASLRCLHSFPPSFLSPPPPLVPAAL